MIFLLCFTYCAYAFNRGVHQSGETYLLLNADPWRTGGQWEWVGWDPDVENPWEDD